MNPDENKSIQVGGLGYVFFYLLLLITIILFFMIVMSNEKDLLFISWLPLLLFGFASSNLLLKKFGNDSIAAIIILGILIGFILQTILGSF